MHRTERLVTGPSNIMYVGMYVYVCICVHFSAWKFYAVKSMHTKDWLQDHRIYCMQACMCMCIYMCVCARVCVCACVCALFSRNILHAGVAKGLNDDHKSLSSLFLFFIFFYAKQHTHTHLKEQPYKRATEKAHTRCKNRVQRLQARGEGVGGRREGRGGGVYVGETASWYFMPSHPCKFHRY